MTLRVFYRLAKWVWLNVSVWLGLSLTKAPSLAEAGQSASAKDPVVPLLLVRAKVFWQQPITDDTLPDPKPKLRLMNFTTVTYIAGFLPIMLGSGMGSELMWRMAVPGVRQDEIT